MLNQKNKQILFKIFIRTGIPSLLAGIIIILADRIYNSNNLSVLPALLFLALVALILVGIVNFLSILLEDIQKLSKRKLYQRIMLIGLSFVTIIFLIILPPRYESIYTYFQSGFIYLLLLVMIYCLGKIFYEHLTTKYIISENKLKLIKPIFLLMIVVLLITVSQLQIYFIYRFTIPPLYGCSYYDKYNNLIYTSQYEGLCPNLDNLEFSENENGSELTFTVHEEFFRNDEKNKKQIIEKYTVYTDITYKYDQNNRVIDYHMNKINQFFYYDRETKTYQLFTEKTYTKEINNTYHENQFISVHEVKKTNENKQNKTSYTTTIEFNSIKEQLNSRQDSIKVTYSESTNPGEVLELFNILRENSFDKIAYRISPKNKSNLLNIDYFIHNDSIEIQTQYLVNGFSNNLVAKSERYLTSSIDKKLILLTSAFQNYTHYFLHETGNLIIESKDNDYEYTSVIVNTNYGFRLEHYNEKRDHLGRYLEYKQVNDYFVGERNNLLSVDLITLNDYSHNLNNLSNNLNYVYQKNPLLFE